jgi:hypothetical protein
MEKIILGQLSIFYWVTLPAYDRDFDKVRFKRTNFGVYRGITEERAKEFRQDFIVLNPDLPEDSLVFEFQPYPTNLN